MKFSRAFTMIELIFVIVILGILAAVALPRFGKTKEIADIGKGRADIATIRAAIVNERQGRLILGISSYIPVGSGTYVVSGKTYKQIDNGGLFGGLLTYPITDSDSDGNWHSTASGTYTYKVNGVGVVFTYHDSTDATPALRGTFRCNTADATCKKLVE